MSSNRSLKLCSVLILRTLVSLLFSIISFACIGQDSDSLKLSKMVHEASVILDQNRFEEALSDINEILPQITKEKHFRHYAEASLLKVTALMRMRRFNEADSLRLNLEEEIQSTLERPDQYFGWVALLKGEILYRQEKFTEAIPSLKIALKEYLPIENGRSFRRQARVYNVLGAIYGHTSYYDVAAEHFNSAMAVTKKIPNSDAYVSNYLNNLATVYYRQGLHEHAIDVFLQAIELRTKTYGDQDPYLSSFYTNLSILYAKKQSYNLALQYQLQAFNLSEIHRKNDLKETHLRHTSLAKSLIDVRQDSLAGFHLEKAQEALDKLAEDLPAEQARIDNQLGLLYEVQDQPRMAIKHFELAAQNYVRALKGSSMESILAMNSVALNYGKLGQYDKAQKYLRENISLLKQIVGSEHEEVSSIYIQFANNYRAQGQYDKAIEASIEAIEANEGYSLKNEMFFENVQNKNRLLLSLITKATILKEKYELSDHDSSAIEALKYYRYCDAIVTQLQENEPYEDKLLILNNLDQVYDDIVELEYSLYSKTKDDQHLDNLFRFASRGKDALLREQLNFSDQKKYGEIPSEVLDLEQKLKEDISYIQSQLYRSSKITENQKSDSIKLQFYQNRLFKKKRTLDSLKVKLREDYSTYFNIRYLKKEPSIESLKLTLDKQTQVIKFVTTENYVFVQSINSDTHEVYRLKSTPALSLDLNHYLSILGDPKSSISELNKKGHALYSQLLKPVGELRKKLIIEPDGELSLLSFETLITSSEDSVSYLVNDHSVSYTNSSFRTNFNSKETRSKDFQILGIASSYTYQNSTAKDTDTWRFGLGPLIWTVSEVEGIMELYNGEMYLEEKATESNFKNNVKGKNVIHIASHGIVDNEQPLFSRLIFEKDPLDSLNDGNLFVHELYNMSLDAEMVVLSACNTASGKVAKGEGVLNIGRGFSYAGVPSVVMSHWQVDDQSTSILMKYFYESLAEGKSKSEALRDAKLRFMSEASTNKKHPFFWGAFITMGDDSPIVRQSSPLTMIMIGVVILILFIRLVRNRSQQAST